MVNMANIKNWVIIGALAGFFALIVSTLVRAKEALAVVWTSPEKCWGEAQTYPPDCMFLYTFSVPNVNAATARFHSLTSGRNILWGYIDITHERITTRYTINEYAIYGTPLEIGLIGELRNITNISVYGSVPISTHPRGIGKVELLN